MTTTNQQAALEQSAVRTAYFIELQFASGTQRLSTFNQPITWGGFDWSGLGTLGGISAVEESDGLESKSLTFTLNVAQPSWFALAIGAVEEYRGLPAKLYMCPMDEQFRLIDTPEICWRGIMDMISIGIDGDEGQISLKCETSAYGLKRRPTLRLNAAQYRLIHPGDPSLDYVTQLIANPQTWLSKKFQQV